MNQSKELLGVNICNYQIIVGSLSCEWTVFVCVLVVCMYVMIQSLCEVSDTEDMVMLGTYMVNPGR